MTPLVSSRRLDSAALTLFALVVSAAAVPAPPAHATGRSFMTGVVPGVGSVAGAPAPRFGGPGGLPHSAVILHPRTPGVTPHAIHGLPDGAIAPGHAARGGAPAHVPGEGRAATAPGFAPLVLPPRGPTVIVTPGAPTLVVVPGHRGGTVVAAPRHGPAPSLLITPGTRPFPLLPPDPQGRIVTAGELPFPPVAQPPVFLPAGKSVVVTAPGSVFLAAPVDGFIAVPNRGFIVAPGDAPVFVGPPGTQRTKIITP